MTTQTSTVARTMHFNASATDVQAEPSQDNASVRRRRERREYWVIFGVCLAFFIVATTIARLLRVARLRRTDDPRSIWAEAKEEATLCTAAAFQG
jgi:hypothetical protein